MSNVLLHFVNSLSAGLATDAIEPAVDLIVDVILAAKGFVSPAGSVGLDMLAIEG